MQPSWKIGIYKLKASKVLSIYDTFVILPFFLAVSIEESPVAIIPKVDFTQDLPDFDGL